MLQEIKHFTLYYYPGVEGHGFHLGEIAALHITVDAWSQVSRVGGIQFEPLHIKKDAYRVYDAGEYSGLIKPISKLQDGVVMMNFDIVHHKNIAFIEVDSRYFDVAADLLEYGGCENDRR